jgi:putative membrane protein
MPRRSAVVAAVVVVVAAAVPAPASPSAAEREKGGVAGDPIAAPAAFSGGDRSFIEKAANATREEMQIARIVAAKAVNPEVRQLAQAIVADDEAALIELIALAAAAAVDLPASKEAPRESWNKVERRFDGDSLFKLIFEREDAVQLFEVEVRNGAAPALLAYARRRLPVLQQSLQQLIALKRNVK